MTEKNELNSEAIPLGILEDAVVEPVSSTDEYTNIIANVPLRRARSRHMRTANQEKIQFGIRVSVSTRQRLNHFAYVERLTIGDALEKLLDIAEQRAG